MNAIPWEYANNFSSVKAAKKSFVDEYVNNHPHRLSSARLTGSYNIEFDGRVVAGEALTAQKNITNVNYSLFPTWTRVYGEKLPIISDLPSGAVGENKFYVAQDINYFWRFYLAPSSPSEPVKIGEYETVYYERESVEAEWVENSVDIEDIMDSYTFDTVTTYPYFNPYGGHPVSGGRGPDNDENSVALYFYTGAGINYEGPASPIIYRLPWQDPWENESALITQPMTDYIAAANAYSGGGWTGSTSVSAEFT